MTIFQAKEYDPRKARRRNIIIVSAILAAVLVGALAYLYRNWPEEHRVEKFFTALVHQDYKTAYGIWINDPGWQQHPPLARYSYNDFYQDWGPGGEWGLIRTFRIDGSANPKDGNGVVVVVTPNNRKEQARIWVGNDHTMTFSPF